MKTYNQGLEAAADLLVKTAEDYHQMAERIQLELNRIPTGDLGRRLRSQDLRLMLEKQALLEGQAKHILELKV